MGFARTVETEELDTLDAADPRAQRSRRDLRRLNKIMATLSTTLAALDGQPAPRTLLELGAGDGSLMLRLAAARAARWPGVEVTLLDRQDLVTPATLHQLRARGWSPTVVRDDVFAWLERDQRRWDVVFTNLFLHHFAGEALARLLALVARRCGLFFACEPRRATLPLIGSHLVGVVGAGPVTRKDAVASVRAGFRAQELTALWPDRAAWHLRESSAGLFGHAFLAVGAP
jgi:hypothetical protein